MGEQDGRKRAERESCKKKSNSRRKIIFGTTLSFWAHRSVKNLELKVLHVPFAF